MKIATHECEEEGTVMQFSRRRREDAVAGHELKYLHFSKRVSGWSSLEGKMYMLRGIEGARHIRARQKTISKKKEKNQVKRVQSVDVSALEDGSQHVGISCYGDLCCCQTRGIHFPQNVRRNNLSRNLQCLSHTEFSIGKVEQRRKRSPTW